MPRRLIFAALFALLAPAIGAAQNKVRTESIKPPAAAPAQPEPGAQTPSVPQAPPPEIITDLSRLPTAVARTRERILDAARSGDLQRLAAEVKSNGAAFSFSEDRDPIAFWKANYPDSDGVEVLAILTEVLEAGFVHVDTGTPQESYMWPYFARIPLKALTPSQRVELFRIITGNDYKEMVDAGAYIFYRLGIAPDGTWQYFVAGD